jgi:DNA-binding NarL/FixJ family response regulator
VHVRVLLADDSDVMRRAVGKLLRERTELDLVGQASAFDEAVTLANLVLPDIVVLDLRLAIQAHCPLQIFKERLTSLRLVAISASGDGESKTLATQLGADAFVDKMELYDKLIPAILRLAGPVSQLEA